MAEQQVTYESVLELIQKSTQGFIDSLEKQSAEFDRRMQEAERERKERDVRYEREKQEADRRAQEAAQEADRRMQKTDRQLQKAAKQLKKTQKEVGKISNSVGRLVENMVAGDNIIAKFHALEGYVIGDYSRNKKFGQDLPDDMRGEIDLFLENGDIAILIEAKASLRTEDVTDFIEKIGRFRRVADHKGDRRRFIGAVAAASVQGDAQQFAHKKGLYVIVQSGDAVEIAPTPTGFQARKW